MEWSEFASQGQSLSSLSSLHPGFHWLWNDSYLSLHTTTLSSMGVTQLTLSVCYSLAYSTPVLYFRGCDLSGSPVDLSEMIGAEAVETDRELRWGLVSPTDHPVTGQPYYYLHPCHNSALITGKPELMCWMSTVLPMVKVRFPRDLARQLIQQSQ